MQKAREDRHAVYIGRFQPFHNGHLAVVKRGLELADTLTIIVGSANGAPSVKNPWSYAQRERMIRASIATITQYANQRVNIVGVRDYYYNENAWLTEVQAKTAALGIDEGALLLGNYKDASSYYFKSFPQWEFTPVRVGAAADIDATSIREALFAHHAMPNWEGKASTLPNLAVLKNVPDAVADQIAAWCADNPTYVNLTREYKFLQDYKASWEVAPYPPTFVTVDACVVASGHVLVVKRGGNPGKGLYALPGGFLKPSERIEDGMLRELREETRITVDKLVLAGQIEDSKVFDHPERSLRGRTISHGYYIKLKDGVLPGVKAADDADEAFWMPLMDVGKNEDKFFEDHAHIINFFVGA